MSNKLMIWMFFIVVSVVMTLNVIHSLIETNLFYYILSFLSRD